MGRKKRTTEEILLDYIEQAGPLSTPCWVTPYRINEDGYVLVKRPDKTIKGHRFFYENLVGPIPEDRELDHLCRVRHCVNPGHCEPVTHSVNVFRGHQARGLKTHCRKGHPLTGDKVYIRKNRPNQRDCKICHTTNNRILRKKQRTS